jgi:hypothetical protein
MVIWDVPALKVRLVELEKSKLPFVPVTRTVEVPRLMARVLELLERKLGVVTENPAVFSVPLVTVRDVFVLVKGEPRVHTPPTPLNVTALASETPFVVTVFPAVVAVKVTLPPRVQTVLKCSVILPAMLRLPPVPACVTPLTLMVRLRQFWVAEIPLLIVRGAPLFASK